MPQEWNGIWVVASAELVPYYGSYDNLIKSIQRDKNRAGGLRRVQKGGNGREMLINYDTLPNEIQNALGDPRKVTHILELFYREDLDAVKFYNEYRFLDGTYLSIAHQEQYIINASVLGALLRLKANRISERTTKGGSLKGLLKSLLNDANLYNELMVKRNQPTHTLPSSEKRFKTTLNQFDKNGYISLISKKHRNENAKKVDDEILVLLNSLFATQLHKPTRTEVSKQYEAFLAGYVEVINNSTGELYDPAGFKPLSEASIINWLGKWEHRIATFSQRSGNRQRLFGMFKTPHSLEQPKFAGSILSVDDRQPPFSYGKNRRVWFYNGIDLASECFTVSVHGRDKEGLILEFYRQLVRNYHEWGLNLPNEIEAEMSLNSQFLGSFLRNGWMFNNVRIEANNARGKRIEAYYRPLRYGLEKQREGWLARPFATSEPNQAGKEAIPDLPFDTIVENGYKDIATWNNMPHSKFPEMSRWEYFLKNQNPKLTPTNYKGFLPFLGYRTKTSCNVGEIYLNNNRYLIGDRGVLLTDEHLINVMSRIEGRDITVYWLDGHDGEIIKAHVYMGDTYICEAIPKPKYNRAVIEQTEEDLKNRELMSKYVAVIEAYRKDAISKLERLVVVDNRVVTVNDKFKPEMLRGMPYKEVVEHETEILPEPEDTDPLDLPAPKPKSRNLYDRF